MTAHPAPASIKGWCPGALRPMRTGDGLLVRLRITGGRISPDHLHAIANLSRRHGNGLIDLSQRANLQLRGVPDASLPELLASLQALNLVDNNPDAEAVRNVTAPPLAGLDPTAKLNGTRLVQALEGHLANDPELHALPSKFGFLVDDGGAIPMDDVPADIRLVGTDNGVLISIGGHAQSSLHLCIVPENDAPQVATDLAKTFLALRAQVAPEARRFRHLLDALSGPLVDNASTTQPEIERNSRQIQRSAIRSATPSARLDPVHANSNIDSILANNASSRTRPKPPLLGQQKSYLGAGAPFGRFTADQLQVLASLGEIRLTPWRLVLLPAAPPSAEHILSAAGLILSPTDPRLSVAACAGLACSSGQIDAQSIATRLAPLAQRIAFDVAQRADSGVTLHISGCTKGCARPTATAAVLVGNIGAIDLIQNGRADDIPAHSGLDLNQAETILNSLTPEGRP